MKYIGAFRGEEHKDVSRYEVDRVLQDQQDPELAARMLRLGEVIEDHHGFWVRRKNLPENFGRNI